MGEEDDAPKSPMKSTNIKAMKSMGDALVDAEELKKLIPHCEMHVAKTLEDTEQWPRMIRDFIRSISRSSEGNVVRREGTTVTTMFHDKDYETEVTTTDWDTTDHDRY